MLRGPMAGAGKGNRRPRSAGLSIGLWGSGEFEPWCEEPERWLLSHASAGIGRVLVLPTASAPEGDDVFDRWSSAGLEHYRTIGIPAEVVPLKTRADANATDIVRRLQDASMVYFSGGNPAYLARTLAGSAFWLALVDAIERGVAYAGCSAGIVALGDRALDSAAIGRIDDDAWAPGLALFDRTSFGAHWDMLPRYIPGFRESIVERVPRGGRLVGVDERTAMVGDGRSWRVFGVAAVHVIERSRTTDHDTGSSFELDLAPA